MLSKYRWVILAIIPLAVCYAITAIQPVKAEDAIATVTSIDHAPYSKVFYSGSIYAVRDHDYEGSDPAIGVSTLWSNNPADGNLSLGVRYCVPKSDLVGVNTSLTKLVLLDNNQSLVTVDQPIKITPSYQRVVQDSSIISEPGFWGPATYWDNDAFWDGFDDSFGYSTVLPAVLCSAGSSQFNITPLASTIDQLPAQTLQMSLIFSNGATSQWKLGHRTVQALKALLTVHQTSSDASQTPAE
jgi:hypothetical protein